MMLEQIRKMKISDYLSYAKFFPLMGVSAFEVIGDQLDSILKTNHGLKTCGTLITSSIDMVTMQVSPTMQEAIAKQVWLLNRNKWQSLIDFADAELAPYAQGYSKTTTTYGHIIEDKAGGKDTIENTDKKAGFDSIDFVNDSNYQHDTTYGKTNKTTNSGENIIESERRDTQAERLVDYTLGFWDRYGIVRTVIADALREISLPLYDLD